MIIFLENKFFRYLCEIRIILYSKKEIIVKLWWREIFFEFLVIELLIICDFFSKKDFFTGEFMIVSEYFV